MKFTYYLFQNVKSFLTNTNMKKVIYLLSIALFAISSCKESPYMFFDSENRVQMQSQEDILYSFYYEPEDFTEHTLYINVQAIGMPKDNSQKVTLEQVTESYVIYEYDNNGAIVDSVVHEYTNKGVAGTHYVKLDDPRVSEQFIIPANKYQGKIPIIVKRDKSLKKEDIRICLKIVANEDLKLGQSNYLRKTIIISDKLSMPNLWPDYMFGDYSATKHAFMVKIAKEKLDDEWFNKLAKAEIGIKLFWVNKFTSELIKFNEDPANIANGTAPMREDQNDPQSPIIDFIYKP